MLKLVKKGFLFLIGLAIAFTAHLLLPSIVVANPQQVEMVRQAIYQDIVSEDESINVGLVTVGAAVGFTADGYAVGSWGIGEMGGMSILRWDGQRWVPVCSTGGAYTAGEMMRFCNIPQQPAQQLFEVWSQF